MHRVVWEFLQEVNNLDEEEGEKLRREMFENTQELLAEMVHTKEGSRVAREFIVRGGAKVGVARSRLRVAYHLLGS